MRIYDIAIPLFLIMSP